MSNVVLIYTTFPNTEEAKLISKTLLNDKLVVCANIFPEVDSLYLWEGEINNSSEVITIMKSRSDKASEVVEKIETMHSYDQPVITVISVEEANESFVNWINGIIDM